MSEISPNEIIINGVSYVKKGSTINFEYNGITKIVVLQRGWVLVGVFEENPTVCKLHNASVIRTWGTTEGLGELASLGPRPSTKLDKCNGLVEFDKLTMVLSISVNEDAWAKKL